MIDFACKTFNIDEIIKCGLGLTKVELEIFYFLLKADDMISSKELSVKINRDNSTVQRALKKFYERELVDRKQINLKKGGYSFIYSVKSKTEIKNILIKIIHKWVSNVETAFDSWANSLD